MSVFSSMPKRFVLIPLFCGAMISARASAQATVPAVTLGNKLPGLWKATKRYGPDAKGALALVKEPGGWRADFVGRSWPVTAQGSRLSFALPDDQGSFLGRLSSDKRTISGQWTSPRSQVHGGRFASPVTLRREAEGRLSGIVSPREDVLTLYLSLTHGTDGEVAAFLRNPQRNLGARLAADRLRVDGNHVTLLGKLNGRGEGQELASGTFDQESDVLRLSLRGSVFEFERDSSSSNFYPRASAGPYRYAAPLPRNDGWPVATVEDVSIDRGAIERFIQMLVNMPVTSAHTLEPHAILMARHGKLVLEEYFHGESRDKVHDTRSAGKVLVTTLIGAAMHSGAPISLATPLYEVMNGGRFPDGLDPRKRAITIDHLLTMRGGFFCDDSHSGAPGNENTMLDQNEEPDFIRYSLAVPMAGVPGGDPIYCSMMPNLALAALGKVMTGEPVLDTFQRLLASPLQIADYAWPLDPAGNPYGGGGVQLTARDFAKFGQLMLNGGTWKERRILDRSYVRTVTAPLYTISGIDYGHLWWSLEMPYKNRKVRGYFANGNGGQAVMVVPDLDLLVTIFAGNYGDRISTELQQDFVANYLLPAVREPGDRLDAPITNPGFRSPYGRK